MSSFLEAHRRELNLKQLEAVSKTEGPVLILAGAGSGKTRVLTYRIAHLIYDLQVPLYAILAMTFSNKAAREMHDRVKALLHDESGTRFPWISTFHSVSARILRMYGVRLGFKSDFGIYDDSDQLAMMKTCAEKLRIADDEVSADAALKRMGDWKNEAKFWEQALETAASTFDEKCALLYKAYQEEMLKAQAMDFDDLLLYTYKIFRDNEDVRSYFRAQWKYVLIDEFQDTNKLQYKLLVELLNPERNICVVGDDDQSIYGWRGAKVENILEFDKEFSDCHVIKLEQNYRSTSNIIQAAAAVIARNEVRHKKTLWTDAGPGMKIRLAALEDDRAEAQFVVGEIRRALGEGVSPKEVAIFYRVNSLSRGFEEECLKQRLPYQIIGGFRFYERKEIKDVLSYFKILLNPADIMAFRRTVNTPLRGIGKASIDKIEARALESHKPIANFLAEVVELPFVSGKARQGLTDYNEYLRWGLSAIEGSESLVDLFIDGLKKNKYMEMLEIQKNEESSDRLENIRELLSAVQEFEESWQPSTDLDLKTTSVRAKLRDFLERVSLMADVDQMAGAEKDQITLMSLHAAKGLEFKVCFMAGMEEGLMPSARSFDSYERSEEERRLCYVGITRAREKLYITRANRRRSFGSVSFNLPSRFLRDFPKDILETVRDETETLQEPTYFYGARAGYTKMRTAAAEDFEFDQRVTDDADFGFKKGDKVAHPSFGDGIVQKAERLGSDECLSIVFAGRGLKKVLAKFVAKR